MKKKITSLLITSSFVVFCATGAVFASSFSAPSASPIADIEEMAAKGYLASKEAHLKAEASGLRLSHLEELLDPTNARFREYYMLGDGNCGLYSMGFASHQEAKDLLLAAANRGEIRGMAHYEILTAFRENRLPQSMFNTRELNEMRDQRDVIDLVKAEAGQMLAEERADFNNQADIFFGRVAAWAKTEEAYRSYINNVLVNGHFMDFNTDHYGVQTEPSFLDILARLLNKNLTIYVQEDYSRRILVGREAGNVRMRVAHKYTNMNIDTNGTLFLINRGNHFNRVVPSNDAAASAAALVDEARHIDSYLNFSGSILKAKCMVTAKLAQKHLIETLGDLSALDGDLQGVTQGTAGYLGRDEQLKTREADKTFASIKQNALVTLLARAYAIKVDTMLQENEGIDPRWQVHRPEKIARYRTWSDTLKARMPSGALDELSLSQDLFVLYQGVADEVTRFKSVKVDPSASDSGAGEEAYRTLMEEWKDVLEPAYKKASRDFGDGKSTYVRGFVTAKEERSAAAKKSVTISQNIVYEEQIVAGGRVYVPVDKSIKTDASYAEVERTLRARRQDVARLNPNQVQFDPYLKSYDFAITGDPRYQKALQLGEIHAFERDVLLTLQGARDDTAQLGAQLDKLKYDELSWRRLKRLYDHYLGGDKTSAAKLAAARGLMGAVLSNWDGCIDGVKDAIGAAEWRAFSGDVPETFAHRISQLITTDRLYFVRQHKKLFPRVGEDGARARLTAEYHSHYNAEFAMNERPLYVPYIMEHRMMGAISIPGTPIPLTHACGATVAALPQFSPASLITRYLDGGQVSYGDHGYNYRDINTLGRTPDYLSNMLHALTYLTQSMPDGDDGTLRERIAKKADKKEFYDEAVALFPEFGTMDEDMLIDYMNRAKGFNVLLNDFINLDAYLNQKMNKVLEFEEDNFFDADHRRPYKKAFFDYLLRKLGYVIDPAAPAEEKAHYWWNEDLLKLTSSTVNTVMQEKCSKMSEFYAKLLNVPVQAAPLGGAQRPAAIPNIHMPGVAASSSGSAPQASSSHAVAGPGATRRESLLAEIAAAEALYLQRQREGAPRRAVLTQKALVDSLQAQLQALPMEPLAVPVQRAPVHHAVPQVLPQVVPAPQASAQERLRQAQDAMRVAQQTGVRRNILTAQMQYNMLCAELGIRQ